MNRPLMDKWSKREQLCLASAVSCSGDQNWITVSRTLKAVCGNESRPSDWYSQKNCAVQYGHLLETVESTKRKKRESGAGISSPLPVEPPTELLLKRLTEERMTDIKTQIRKDQEEYAALCREIKAIQSGRLSNEEVREMWRQIESQQETQRIDEMKMENRMREREQRKQEMIGNWPAKRVGSNTDTTSVDMDVEESASETKTIAITQQPQPATSPLLSSLLKSPTAGSNSACSNTNVAGGSTARTTAPTITTLLTSGNIPNQPAITLRSNVPASETAFINRPISGPPAPEVQSPTLNTGKSPSQAAPTLSMLLEKNKNISSTTNTQTSVNLPNKTSESDANNEEVPMDIEESTPVATKLNTGPTETDETDPNEEQQLLEVFKNIGNMDDIDIDMVGVIDDEEVDFLEDVAASPNEAKPSIDFEEKLDELKSHETTNTAEGDATKTDEENKPMTDKQIAVEKDVIKVVENVKPEIVASSDDSNDNIPLAEVASLENKERSQSATDSVFVKAEKDESNEIKEVTKVENVLSDSANLEKKVTYKSDSSEDSKPTAVSIAADDNSRQDDVPQDSMELDSDKNVKQKIPIESDSSDVVLIPTDDDESVFEKPAPSRVEVETETQASTDIKTKLIENASEPNVEATSFDAKSPEDGKTAAVEAKIDIGKLSDTSSKATPSSDTHSQPTVISIGDTDEDSSMTDASKDDAGSNKSTVVPTITQRSHKPILEESKSEIETTVTQAPSVSTSTASATPVRPQALRKLVDRSESPMIEDDTTTTSDHSTKPNSRRRYSSTPVIDSIPNSPASSEYADDRRETRGASKKMFINIYNTLNESKHASIFRRGFHDEHSQKFAELCFRPMDLPTIKRNIDSGGIRNVSELHRDVLLMCQNVLMLYRSQTSQHKTALAFLQDCHNIKEFTMHTTHHDNRHLSSSHNTSTSKARSGSRKSQRHI